MNLYNTLAIVSVFSQFVALSFAFLCITRNNSNIFRYILAITAIGTMNELITYFVISKGISTQLLGTGYLILEFLIFCRFFQLSIMQFNTKLLILTLCVFYTIVFLYELPDFGYYKFTFPLLRSVHNIILIILSLLLFYSMLNNYEAKRISSTAEFWIASACLIFFSTGFLLFLFSKYLSEKSMDLLASFYIIQTSANIIFNTLLAISFTKKSYVS